MFDSLMNLPLMNIPGGWLVLMGIGVINLMSVVIVLGGRPPKPNKWYRDSRSDSRRVPPIVTYKPTRDAKYDFKITRKDAQ